MAVQVFEEERIHVLTKVRPWGLMVLDRETLVQKRTQKAGRFRRMYNWNLLCFLFQCCFFHSRDSSSRFQ